MTTFKLLYKVSPKEEYQTLTLHPKYFNPQWEDFGKDRILDEITEYMHVDLDDKGYDSEDDDLMNDIQYKNRDEIINEIFNYFMEKENG